MIAGNGYTQQLAHEVKAEPDIQLIVCLRGGPDEEGAEAGVALVEIEGPETEPPWAPATAVDVFHDLADSTRSVLDSGITIAEAGGVDPVRLNDPGTEGLLSKLAEASDPDGIYERLPSDEQLLVQTALMEGECEQLLVTGAQLAQRAGVPLDTIEETLEAAAWEIGSTDDETKDLVHQFLGTYQKLGEATFDAALLAGLTEEELDAFVGDEPPEVPDLDTADLVPRDRARVACENHRNAAGRVRRHRGGTTTEGRQRFRFAADGAHAASSAIGPAGGTMRVEATAGVFETSDADAAKWLRHGLGLRELS